MLEVCRVVLKVLKVSCIQDGRSRLNLVESYKLSTVYCTGKRCSNVFFEIICFCKYISSDLAFSVG